MVAELAQKLFYRIDEDVKKFPEVNLQVNNAGRVKINVFNNQQEDNTNKDQKARVPRVYINESGKLVQTNTPSYIDVKDINKNSRS